MAAIINLFTPLKMTSYKLFIPRFALQCKLEDSVIIQLHECCQEQFGNRGLYETYS